MCGWFSSAVYPAGALHGIGSCVDAAGIEGAARPSSLNLWVWVTQPLALTREENKNGAGSLRGPSGLVSSNTAPHFAAFTGVSGFAAKLFFVNAVLKVHYLLL